MVPLLLPLFYACLSFLILYLTSWDFVVAYVTISGGLLSKFVSKLISIMSCVCLYPNLFYDPVFFLQCGGLLSYFLYEMISIFLVFEGVQGHPAICVYYYCSWNVFVYFYCLCYLWCFNYCHLFCLMFENLS